MQQNHYTLLGIDKNVSSDVVKLAYERLLEDAKLKLQDSPLFFEKEKNLKEAYQVLSNPQRREYYDNTLLRNQIKKSRKVEPVESRFNLVEFLSRLILSKLIWGGLALVAIVIWFTPGKQEQLIQNNQQQILSHYQKIQEQQLERMHQDELRYSGARNSSSSDYQARRALQQKQRQEKQAQRKLEREIKQIAQQEKSALAKIESDEARVLRIKSREEKKLERKLQQRLASEKRARERRENKQRSEAQRRSDALIRNQQYQQNKQKRNATISSGSL